MCKSKQTNEQMSIKVIVLFQWLFIFNEYHCRWIQSADQHADDGWSSRPASTNGKSIHLQPRRTVKHIATNAKQWWKTAQWIELIKLNRRTWIRQRKNNRDGILAENFQQLGVEAKQTFRKIGRLNRRVAATARLRWKRSGKMFDWNHLICNPIENL